MLYQEFLKLKKKSGNNTIEMNFLDNKNFWDTNFWVPKFLSDQIIFKQKVYSTIAHIGVDFKQSITIKHNTR